VIFSQGGTANYHVLPRLTKSDPRPRLAEAEVQCESETMGRRLALGLTAAVFAGAAGCAEIIGAGFDDARLAGDDDAGGSGGADVVAPDGADAYVAPSVDAGVDQSLSDTAPGPETGPPDAGSSCDASVGNLLCAAFAGNWETQDPACHGGSTTSTCRHPDPFTNACTCPAGSTSSGSMLLLLDCSDGVFRRGEVDFCDVTGSQPTGDWAGAYQVQCTDSTCNATTCQVNNPFTNGCTCPGSSSALTFDEVYDNGITGQMTLCYNPGAPAITFAGAYQTKGNGCLVPNPETSACSCPGDAGIYGVRVLTDVASPTPSPVWACVPGH
jgi:hypothetical protein